MYMVCRTFCSRKSLLLQYLRLPPAFVFDWRHFVRYISVRRDPACSVLSMPSKACITAEM